MRWEVRQIRGSLLVEIRIMDKFWMLALHIKNPECIVFMGPFHQYGYVWVMRV